MKRIDDTTELLARLRDVRSKASEFTTNWFVQPAQLEAWVGTGRLFVDGTDQCVILFRADRDFYHIYHWASSENALSNALGAMSRAMTLTADLVERSSPLSRVADRYAIHGFRHLTTLIRMSCATAQLPRDEFVSARVVVAAPSDAPDVARFLEGLLDRFADQIPEVDEIAAAAARGNVLIVRDRARVAGVLCFELHGQTAILRYWWIGLEFRGQGIGGMLIRTLFRACTGSKQLLLWVVDGNENAIAKYEHYGFRRDGLVDRIMIRTGEQ